MHTNARTLLLKHHFSLKFLRQANSYPLIGIGLQTLQFDDTLIPERGC